MHRTLLLLLVMNFLPFFARGASPLPVGAQAPRITAQDQDGRTVDLADVYAKGITLVYFYPKAETPGCTAEACSLRDAYEGLRGRGLQILGVSRDSVAAQKQFQENRHLPFTLLADPEGKLAEAFGVSLIPVVGLTTRQSFLIQGGRIVWSTQSAKTSGAAEEVQKALDTLQKQ